MRLSISNQLSHSTTLRINHTISAYQRRLITKLYSNPKAYEDFFYVENAIVNELANEVTDHFERTWLDNEPTNKDKKKEVKLLALGVGNGRFEIPIMRELQRRNYELDVSVCDITPQMLKTFNQNFKDAFSGNGRINLRSSNLVDASDFLRDQVESGVKYDLILCFFLLHMLPNWEETLYLICQVCDESSALVISEELGDTCWIDNCFTKESDFSRMFEKSSQNHNLRAAHKRFWQLYHGFRADKLREPKPWIPQLRAADTEVVREICNSLFVSRKKIWKAWRAKNLSTRHLKAWATNFNGQNIFYPLEYGLDKGDFEQIVNQIDQILEDASLGNDTEKIERYEGIEIFCYSKLGVSSELCDNVIRAGSSRHAISYLSTEVPSYRWGEKENLFLPHRATLWKFFLRYFIARNTHLSYYLWQPSLRNPKEGKWLGTLPFALLNFDSTYDQIAKYLGTYYLYTKLLPENFFVLQSLLTDFPKIFSLSVSIAEQAEHIVSRPHFEFQSIHCLQMRVIDKGPAIVELIGKETIDAVKNGCLRYLSQLQNSQQAPVSEKKSQIPIFSLLDLAALDEFLEKEQISQRILSLKERFSAAFSEDIQRISQMVEEQFRKLYEYEGWKPPDEDDQDRHESLLRNFSHALLLLSLIGEGTDRKISEIAFLPGGAFETETADAREEIGFGGIIVLYPRQDFNYYQRSEVIENDIHALTVISNAQTRADGIKIYSDLTSKAAKDAEWKVVFDEIPHTVNNDINAISTRIELAKRRVINDKDTVEHLEKASRYLNYWSNSNAVLQHLSRGEGEPLGRVGKINIRYLVKESLLLVRDSIELLKVEESKANALAEKLTTESLENLLINIAEPPEAGIVAYVDAVLVLFIDVFKNALRYCDPFSDDFISVRSEVSDDSKVYRLHICNNLPLGGTLQSLPQAERNEARVQIKKMIEGEPFDQEKLPFSKSGRIGFRVVGKIIDFLGWERKVLDGLKESSKTNIVISVPIGARDDKKN